MSVVTLHAFCSAKGGVGKSTLAVAWAKLLAFHQRRCVLIDADLTGTSLADGLDLLAPKVKRTASGVLDFFAEPTGEHFSREETVRARNRRRGQDWKELPPEPPYLNDILIQGERGDECCISSLFWKHEHSDGVDYLPSSPLRQDIAIALGWPRGEAFDWLQRFMWLLHGMREQIPALSDVVIDLPPGLAGFAHETLALLANLATRNAFPSGFPDWNPDEWQGRPFLVSTEDRNDFLVALEYWNEHRGQLKNLQVLLNRSNQGRSAWMSDQISRHFAGLVRSEDVPWIVVGDVAPLRELFIGGDLHLTDDVKRLYDRLLGNARAPA